LFVEEVDAGANLNKEVESRIFSKVLLLANEIEEVALARVLQGQVDRSLVFETRVQAADVLVVQLLLDLYFSDQGFSDFARLDRTLLNLLNSY